MKKILLGIMVILLSATTYTLAVDEAPGGPAAVGEGVTNCPGVVDVDCGRPGQRECPPPVTPTVAPKGGAGTVDANNPPQNP